MEPMKPVLSDSVELSLVVPCYNENPHIETLLQGWVEEISEKGISYEIIAINDGSLDGTGRILDKLRKENKEVRVVHQLNMGHVRACRRGYEMARGHYILCVSANGRFEPSDFSPLWNARENHLMVLGSRTHRLDGFISKRFTSFVRMLASQLFGIRLEEPGIPFRLFLRQPTLSLLKEVPMDWESFHWTMTILLSLRFPGRVIEAKVPYRHRLERQSPFRRTGFISLAWTYLCEALSLKFSLLRKKNEPYSLESQMQVPI
jgi:glycosyltransferase involved in cell wall biosynthesis